MVTVQPMGYLGEQERKKAVGKKHGHTVGSPANSWVKYALYLSAYYQTLPITKQLLFIAVSLNVLLKEKLLGFLVLT